MDWEEVLGAPSPPPPLASGQLMLLGRVIALYNCHHQTQRSVQRYHDAPQIAVLLPLIPSETDTHIWCPAKISRVAVSIPRTFPAAGFCGWWSAGSPDSGCAEMQAMTALWMGSILPRGAKTGCNQYTWLY